MINIKNIRELYIASDRFDTFKKSHLKNLDYKEWKEYIDNLPEFIWFEDTKDGQEILSKIDTIPDDFKESFVSLFNYTSCYRDLDIKKNRYNIGVVFHKELKRITVSFEKKVTIEDLKVFLEMAKHLDALLLKDGVEIIGEKVIEDLEQKK